jgi:hypothetical protein
MLCEVLTSLFAQRVQQSIVSLTVATAPVATNKSATLVHYGFRRDWILLLEAGRRDWLAKNVMISNLLPLDDLLSVNVFAVFKNSSPLEMYVDVEHWKRK